MIDKKDGTFLGQNIKGVMMTLIARWNGQMDAARANTEFADVRPADMRLFAQLRGRTMRLSEIHREMGFSRQAAQQAVERLIRHDMVSLDADPNSKRDKIVSITDKGQRWRTLAAEQIRLIETEISKTLGETDTEHLRRSLLALAAR